MESRRPASDRPSLASFHSQAGRARPSRLFRADSKRGNRSEDKRCASKIAPGPPGHTAPEPELPKGSEDVYESTASSHQRRTRSKSLPRAEPGNLLARTPLVLCDLSDFPSLVPYIIYPIDNPPYLCLYYY